MRSLSVRLRPEEIERFESDGESFRKVRYLLEDALKNLHAEFWTGRVTLSQIMEAANYLSDQFTQKGELIALSLGSADEDTWCIDNRGVLSLSLSKETYESLGLVGVECAEGHNPKFRPYSSTSLLEYLAEISH